VDHPRHARALIALERLYDDAGDTEQLSRILKLQAAAFAELESKKGALRESVRLSEKSREKGMELPEGARSSLPQACEALLAVSPSDRAGLRLAELAALNRPSPEDLAAVDRRYIEVLGDGPLASSYRTRLGEFLEPRNPVQALEQHRPALEVDRENIGSARGLSRIAQEVDEPSLLLEAAEYEATVVCAKDRAAELLVRAASALAKDGDSDRAVKSLKRALTLYPSSASAASLLHELLSVRSEFEDLTATLSAAAQACTDPEIAAEHWIAVARISADERDDVPAALAALTRLEKSGTRSLPATLELAELYVRDRQWKPAVARLNQALGFKPDKTILLGVRVRLAEVYHEHLDQLTDASRELRAILSDDPEHQGALRRLLAIQMKEKAAAAVETAHKLVAVSAGREKAEALIALGQLSARAKKRGDAIQSFAGAVGIIGLEPADASEGLRKLLEEGGPDGEKEGWAGYAKALAMFCESASPGQHQARAYLELGSVLGDKQKAAPQAIKALQMGLKSNPKVLELRLDLIARMKKAGMHADALPELLVLLKAEPLRGETWVDLVDVYDATGQNAEAHLATGPLIALGLGTELQRSSWRNRKPQPAMLGPGAFSQAALSDTLREGISLDAMDLLTQLGATTAKVFPPELSRFGASARNKIGPKGVHPARAALDRICHCFGGIEMDLYPSDSTDGLHIVLTDPVGIIVPASIADLPETEQVCLMARYVANVARGAQAVDALSEGELALLLGAAQRLVDPRAKVPGVSESSLAEVGKRLSKALPWLSKGRIEDAAKKYAAAPLADVPRFNSVLRSSAWRAAMILADDIGPIGRLPHGLAKMVGERGDEVELLVADLLPYWASTDAVRLRREIGFI